MAYVCLSLGYIIVGHHIQEYGLFAVVHIKCGICGLPWTYGVHIYSVWCRCLFSKLNFRFLCCTQSISNGKQPPFASYQFFFFCPFDFVNIYLFWYQAHISSDVCSSRILFNNVVIFSCCFPFKWDWTIMCCPKTITDH